MAETVNTKEAFDQMIFTIERAFLLCELQLSGLLKELRLVGKSSSVDHACIQGRQGLPRLPAQRGHFHPGLHKPLFCSEVG